DDDVGREREAGARGDERAHALDVVLARVATRHEPQEAVRARLDGQMHVRRERFELRVRRDEPGGQVTRGWRGGADAGGLRNFAHDPSEEPRELRARWCRATSGLVSGLVPGVDRLTEQGDLAHPAFDETRDLRDDLVRGAVALGAARVRNDAERAAFVAAF